MNQQQGIDWNATITEAVIEFFVIFLAVFLALLLFEKTVK